MTLGKWTDYQESISESAEGGVTYWKVLKEKKSQLDKCVLLGEFVIDTSDWPPNVPDYDPELHWLVDQCVTQ